MIVIEEAAGETIVFTVVLCKLESEGAVGGALAIPFCTLVCWLPLLAPIAVEHVYTVAIRVVSLSPLRDKLDIHRCENVIDPLSNRMYILERLVLEVAYVDVHLQFVILLAFDCCICT